MMIEIETAAAERSIEGSTGQDQGRSDPSTQGTIVAIDDDAMTLRVLQNQLRKCGYRVQTAGDAATGLQLLDDATAVALVDLHMPHVSGFECLRYIRKNHPQVQVIILTGSTETEDAVEAMRAGALQFVTKPFDPQQLQVYIAKAMEASRTAQENRDLRESHCHNLPVQVPVAPGDVNNRLMNQISRLAALESTVFIGGESGTGKSTVARMIHQKSKRADGQFVSINCASLPRDLLTSELFGHTKGSFTGAVKDRAGHAEVADGGTLFLDEIGDLPLELQPKLLTFLQDRTVQRLGSSEVRKVDVRLIVATHRDLAEMCREQAFRQDLFFRLMVLSIDLPPLRHRASELPSMAAGILSRICERMEIPPKRLSESAVKVLLAHSWPGNIRELENVLERAAAFSAGALIDPKDLILTNLVLDRRSTTTVRDPSPVVDTCPTSPALSATRVADSLPHLEPEQTSNYGTGTSLQKAGAVSQAPVFSLAGMSLEEIEREAILQTLEACEGNKAKTARMLGISEKSIYNKMRRLEIKWRTTPA